MKRILSIVLGAAVFCGVYITPSQAIVGAGFHWGFDFTLDMEDEYNVPLTYEEFVSVDLLDNIQDTSPDFANQLPVTLEELKDSIIAGSKWTSTLPILLSRSDWNRSIINFGAKIFADAIPVIDALELSFNIGAWEYNAQLMYPNGAIQDTITQEDVNDFLKTGNYENLIKMDTVDLTLDNMGLSYLKVFGISQTPYTKIHFDLSIRKNLIAKPDKMKLFKLYLGGGPSFHMGTPVLTPEFVQDVVEKTLESAGSNFGDLGALGSDSSLMKKVIEKLINDAKTPTWGMHILFGFMVKPPVIPIGIYVDSKLMIPFGDIDDNVDLRGFGFLINTGVSLSF